jgi:hypothetical protein
MQGRATEKGRCGTLSFARIHDSQLAEEPPPAEDTPPVDDPWAAIAEASGVEPGSAEIAVFRGSAEVEDALERYEAEREAEEAVEATAPTAFPAAIDPDASEGVALPAWDDSKLEDDTVLRAFEAHASLFEGDDEFSEMPPPVSDTEPVVFDDLLGEDADEIVAEASQQPVENRYLGRMQGWALSALTRLVAARCSPGKPRPKIVTVSLSPPLPTTTNPCSKVGAGSKSRRP